MRQRVHPPQRPVRMTVHLDAESAEYLAQIFPSHRGAGSFLSRLVLLHRQRREWEDRSQPVTTRESWELDGLRID
jgi:hypothetical protein